MRTGGGDMASGDRWGVLQVGSRASGWVKGVGFTIKENQEEESVLKKRY